MKNNIDLYQQIILDHNRKPRNFGKMTEPSCCAEGLNPLCGDHLQIYLKIDEEGLIERVTFEGSGCAISKASASMMTTFLQGKKIKDALEIFEDFHLLISGELDPENGCERLGKLKIFAGVSHFPSRVKCAGLAWHAMKGALTNQKKVSTEK